MDARQSSLVVVFTSLLACRAPAVEPPKESSTNASSSPEVPATIELPSEYRGGAARVTNFDSGIVVETLVEGEGERATEGKLVELEYDAYRSDTGERIPAYFARMMVGDEQEAENPIQAAVQLAVDGARAGERARIFVPASFVNASKPERAPMVGDLWLILAIERVREYPRIVGPEAFEGEPIASRVLDDGIEIYDYIPGEGPAAAPGDLVEFVTIIGTADGRVAIHNPKHIAHKLEVGDGLRNEVLEGARAGMLRKFVIPRGTILGSLEGPSTMELAEYWQVTEVVPKQQ